MAKYGKNNYFDGVVLPEPKEEALRRMAKGVNCSDGGFMSAAAELNVVPCSIQCVFKPMVLTDSPQTVFAMSNSASAPRIDLHNGYITAYLGYNSIRIYDIAVDTVYDFVFVCDSDKSILYVNGNLAASFADVSRCSGYKLGYLLVNSTKYHFQGDYLLHRHFNYAISANEVKALDNTDDPAGYVLPANYRGYGDVYHSDFSEGADDWHVVLTDYVTMTVADGVITISKEDERSNMNIARNHNPYASRVVNYFVRLEFAEPLPSEVGNIVARPFNSIVGVNLKVSSDRLSASGTLISTIAKPNGGSMIIFQASGAISISISSISFTPAVCIAEYLPHNLIPTAEGSVVKWLDSAPQLPEANGILPPLDASVGGYDLAAIGNPKIII
jgi:hypothetical protein